MTSSRPNQLLLVGMALVAVIACTATGCRPPSDTASTPAPTPTDPEPVPWPRTITDDLDGAVMLDAPPERIVSLSPAVTEMLFALGAGDRVVGRTSYCDYPPEALEVTEVGTFLSASVEKVLEVDPDLCVAVRGMPKESIDALRDVGLNVVAFDPATVSKALDIMETLGRLVQDGPGPVQVVDELRERVETVERCAAGLPRHPRVLCGVQFEPLYAAGSGTHIDDMIVLAGGENAAGDADTEWPQYSLERMLEKDPEIIIGTPANDDFGDRALLDVLAATGTWTSTSAVQNGDVYMMEDDLLTLPGPRMVDGLEEMAEIIARVAGQQTGQ